MKYIYILVMILVLAIQFCYAQDSESLENEASEAKAMSVENYIKLRDPFYRMPKKNIDDQVAEEKPSELEQYSIEQLNIVGIITGPKKKKALLTTPEGKMHIVTEKTIIGPRRGIVKRIAPGEIRVEETVLNILGKEEKIETVLKFKEKNQNEEKSKRSSVDTPMSLEYGGPKS